MKPTPSFASILGDHMQRFLAYKRALGCKFDTEEKALELLDSLSHSETDQGGG
jgi:hypothetical protein